MDIATQYVLIGGGIWLGFSLLFCVIWAYARSTALFDLEV